MLAFVERFQRRQNERFERKVAESVILRTDYVSTKKLHLIGDQKRVRSLVMLILSILYSLISKAIVGDFSLDLIVLFNVIVFATDMYLRLNDNSVFALNHYKKVSTIKILNKTALLVLFFLTAMLNIEEFSELLEATKEEFDHLAATSGVKVLGGLQYIAVLFKEKPLFMCSFVSSQITLFSVTIFFIKFWFKYYTQNILRLFALIIPILNLVILYRWIMAFRDFEEYILIDDETCQVNYRRLTNKTKVFFKALFRVLIFIVVAIAYVIFLILYT